MVILIRTFAPNYMPCQKAKGNVLTVKPTACDHAPTTVIVLRTKRGYRIRCLRCEALGPTRPTPDLAWVALMGRGQPAGVEC